MMSGQLASLTTFPQHTNYANKQLVVSQLADSATFHQQTALQESSTKLFTCIQISKVSPKGFERMQQASAVPRETHLTNLVHRAGQ